ncbi:MAG TPA: hypothetical protein VM261_02750 [Kofleriaceae bacterium]|nr:hypothetical protein [Kofleriaceae bacterium]
MRLRLRATAAFGSFVVLATAPAALAFRAPPPGLAGDDRLVTPAGPARAYRDTTWNAAPPRATAAWSEFVRQHGTAWTSLWDHDTAVPLRLFGEGISTPGATTDDAKALAAARAIIDAHRALLAPGATAGDLVPAANDLTDGLRSVGFLQYHRGMRVLGGTVSVRIKRDRAIVLASTAFPDIDAPVVADPIAASDARTRATAYLVALGAPGAVASTVSTPVVLPIVEPRSAPRYATVVVVQVDSESPRGRWDVYLDAATGAVVGRLQTLSFGSAVLQMNAPVRWWGGDRRDYPATGASVTLGGSSATADAATGALSWSGATGPALVARSTGPLISVSSQAGTAASYSAQLSDGATVTWNAATSEYADAQISTFVHIQRVKQWARTVSNIPWINQSMRATVNINDQCNAFSDGTDLSFFRASAQCGNTARIADVVYHEFGHSFHNHALISGVGSWDGALSEGLGDFVAATITGDPAMARGFFNTDEPMRHCDPAGSEFSWPEDRGEIHDTGRIYCGAMFDLRKNLIALYGDAGGRARTDRLFYESFRRASDIPSTYAELLAIDDDDGNLANGTPHKCEIDEAYARHGMAEPTMDAGPRVAPPTLTNRTVSMALSPSTVCRSGNVTGGTLTWRHRDNPAMTGTVTMTAGASALTGDLPAVPAGTVVEYQLAATTEVGGTLTYPLNAADPWYQAFFGDATVLYCTDFESDPSVAGWTHALVSGTAAEGADDWQWGAPLGEGGDPATAFSGTRVIGNDLGEADFNGQYQADKVNQMLSPPIDTAGYDIVRLQQRRWLNVEEGASDQASIRVGDTTVWTNLADGTTHHTDGEWRFQDVDLTPAAGGTIRIEYRMTTDASGQYGGWTLDDMCVVAYDRPVTPPETCGDGSVDAAEECDDGNTADGDGCSATCTAEDGGGGGGGGGDVGGGCCGAGPAATGVAPLAGIALSLLLRRRRPGAGRRP